MNKKKLLAFILVLTFGCESTDDDSSLNEPIENNTNINVDSDENSSNSAKTFDREEMLGFIVDQIIIPSFDNLESTLAELKISYDMFYTDTTADNLGELRNKWLASYKAWQHVEMYNIGKAMEDYYLYKGNVYPVDTVRVKNNIEKGGYDLNNPNNYDAQGFPTIDYLLFGLDKEESAVIDHYIDNDKNMAYLGILIDELISNTKAINDDWKATKDSFVKSIENTATSNLNMLVNDFIYYYERGFRANKFGIPAGVFSASALPDRVEGFYSKIYSKDLALEAFTSIKNFFNGVSFESNDVTGPCIKSYLDFLESNKVSLLSDEINQQFNIAEDDIDELDSNFSEIVSTDHTEILTTYDNIQKAVVLLKVDMLQTLNINVDYADADGD